MIDDERTLGEFDAPVRLTFDGIQLATAAAGIAADLRRGDRDARELAVDV